MQEIFFKDISDDIWVHEWKSMRRREKAVNDHLCVEAIEVMYGNVAALSLKLGITLLYSMFGMEAGGKKQSHVTIHPHCCCSNV